MIDPATDMTGRTRLFASVEAFDHELQEWADWAFLDDAARMDADSLLQDAIDAGHDDIRLLLHVTGAREELLM
jgi:hypothetical protein